MAFAVTHAARLLLFPPAGGVLTTRQASLDATDRSPNRALDAALRPRASPHEAGSLLPGLLTATRTGPSPTGDDELMLDQLLNKHLQLWAHTALDEPQSSPRPRGRLPLRPGVSGRVPTLGRALGARPIQERERWPPTRSHPHNTSSVQPVVPGYSAASRVTSFPPGRPAVDMTAPG
jgi:hypothetical protein